MAFFILRCVVGVALLVAPTTISNAGEHSRRAATELAVLGGDLRMFAIEQSSALHKAGLVERINGSLAGLEILLRLADQERGKLSTQTKSQMVEIRTIWQQRDVAQMTVLIADPSASHPFNTKQITALQPTNSGIESAKNLHEEFCSGCHDDPDLDTKRPAYNLFEQATKQTQVEFIARMMVGVRGDRITGIDNPLDDAQISALYNYYKTSEAE